jgi:hypothetical protein
MNKILTNPNKIIGKLPLKINLESYEKKCIGNIGNQIKLKIMEPQYLNLLPEDIIQTFLLLFNNGGKGIFINIIKNKLKNWIVFNNELISIITKNDKQIINKLKKIIEYSLKKSNINCMFFVNLCDKPLIHKEINKKYIPVISFTSSYLTNDIILPLPNTIKFEKINNGYLFIFEKIHILNTESKSNKIYNRILEIKKHPYYKNKQINYFIIDNNINKLELSRVNIIISDPYVPYYYEYIIKSKTKIILIENINYFTYNSKLLEPNKEYLSWDINKWELEFDSIDEFNKLKLYDSIVNINAIYLGLLEHLTLNFYNNDVILSISNDKNLNITTQLDIDKYFNLLEKNYRQLRCLSYRLNPYLRLLTELKTNHNFIPEFYKLSLTILNQYENLNWISPKYVELNNISKMLKRKINTNNYIIDNSNKLLNLEIDLKNSVYYIELPILTSKFKNWESEYLNDFENILQFINNQKDGSTFIIKIYTFNLPRTISLIKNFQYKFEKIKIIKNEYFESFLPFRYLIGINKTKNINNIPIDIEQTNHTYFIQETNELIKLIKYIKSTAKIDSTLFNNNDLIKSWLNKWFE